MNCFKCGKELEPVFDLDDGNDEKLPNGGLIFTASGNYGSRIYDPTMAAPKLVVWICDDCVVKHKDLVQVRRYAHVQTEVTWSDFDENQAYW